MISFGTRCVRPLREDVRNDPGLYSFFVVAETTLAVSAGVSYTFRRTGPAPKAFTEERLSATEERYPTRLLLLFEDIARFKCSNATQRDLEG